MKGIIIDYGVNNLKSVRKAFESIGRYFKITDKIPDVLSADCIILPGIGAFGDGMYELKKRKLIGPIKKKVETGTPILGICLGMQMLFTESEEFGLHKGLNLIRGKVIPFKHPEKINVPGYKVPHMGWNNIKKPVQFKQWTGTLLQNIKEGDEVYFVHSFYPKLTRSNLDCILGTTIYGNQEFCSVVQKDNITGTQFHPEKSGRVGLSILKTFCEVNGI